MTRVIALPHLQTTAVEPDPWLISIRRESQPLPDLLKGWDYETPVRFESKIRIDLVRALAECGLEDDATVALASVFWASSTNRRGLGSLVEIDGSGEYSIAFDVDPAIIGGRLNLERRLILNQPGTHAAQFAARLKGAVLWEESRNDRSSVILEGEAARFPTEVMDFNFGPVAEPESAWWLDYDFSDLDASPLASMRLYLNSSNPLVDQLIRGEESDSASLLRSVLSWDIGRAMINGAINRPDFIDGWGNFRSGSLGETLELLIRRFWPTHDARALRSMRAQDSGLFDARLQSRFRILGGP
jgi:hypothetical protein